MHGHGHTSNLGMEALMLAHTMGLATVFTGHSLYSLDDAESFLVSEMLATPALSSTPHNFVGHLN